MDITKSQRHRGIVNRSAPTATIVPVVIYEDVDKAIDWLCGAFGFTERLRAGDAMAEPHTLSSRSVRAPSC